MKRHDVFATPIWHIEGSSESLVNELYQGAYRFKEKFKSENKSNKGGYQSPPFDWDKFHPQGIEYIESKVKEIIGDDYKLGVDSWWYNINGKGNWNLPHSHPGCDFALVWYLTDSDGLLQIMNPHLNVKLTKPLSNSVTIDAKVGDILMFPAEIVHYVLPNERETDRVSISVNLQLS